MSGLGEDQDSKAKVPVQPVRPSQEEVDRHNAVHVPFRSWCPYCVAGQAKSMPHFAKDGACEPCDTNVVSLDYAFIGNVRKPDVEESEEDNEVDDADEEPEDPREDFGIEGADETGRNIAYATFKKIQSNII